MRTIFFSLLFLLAAGIAAAVQAPNVYTTESVTSIDEANVVLEDAHMAFERGDTRRAMELYRQVALGGFDTPAVWTNAGTAAYRSGEIGKAVLYYERALRMDPNYERARRSLDIVSPATNDVRDSFREEVIAAVFESTSPVIWVLFAEFFYLLVCVAIFRAFKAVDRDQRGHWIAVLAWCAVLGVLCAGLAFANYSFRKGSADAVVLEDRSITRSEPNPTATAQLELPAGTLLELTEAPRRGFVRFKMLDGRTGYIPVDDIEKI